MSKRLETGTSYFGVDDPAHAARDLDRFRDGGLDAVLHTFSERDRDFVRETKTDAVAASEDRGFRTYVNPWGVGGVFGGEAYSAFVAENPDARQVRNTGEREPAACLNHPEFRRYIREWTRDAVALGADVIFWDEPNWRVPAWGDDDAPEDVWCCRCEHCRAGYRERFDEPMPATETDRVSEFREASLVDFLADGMAVAAEEGAENAICLMPVETTDYGLSEWGPLAESDDLDVLATDPYWHDAFGSTDDPEELVGYFAEKVVDLAAANDLESQIWIQGFGLPAGAADDVRVATRTAVESGVDSVFMWGYDGCRTVSEIACEEPMAAWNAFLDALP